MSPGACRAFVAVLLTLMLLPLATVPAVANTERLVEVSTATYTVDPEERTLDVSTLFRLSNREGTPYNRVPWGPIVIEDLAVPRVGGDFEIDRSSTRELPGPWKAIDVTTPLIEPGARRRMTVSYTLDATKDGMPIRIDDGYLYFCVVGQDTDLGSVDVKILGGDRYDLTQTGTPLEITDNGLKSPISSAPSEIFTCIEGTVSENLQTATLVGPGGRQIELQATPSGSNWLVAAENNVEGTLDAIAEFLGQEIPGQGPVIVRQTPTSELGGYASTHDTPGVVQLDDDAGTRDPEHQLAHVWFGADNISERWLREGLAEWIATSMAGEPCEPVSADGATVDLSDWQVVRPTAGEDIDQLMAEQLRVACGIVSTVRERMSDEQWDAVLGALLQGQTKYPSSGGPESGIQTAIDYREWLDAVDELGLVPAGEADLDFAQDLLAAFDIPTDPGALEQRSAARAAYHQFLAEAGGLAAPLAVRQAMDDWEFDAAIANLDKSREVLASIQEADATLPDADLIPVIAPMFEAATSDEELDAVLARSEDLRAMASQVIEPLTELRDALPEGWSFPAAVQDAIVEQRFDDIQTAIPPALEVVAGVGAANEVLPEAGLLTRYQSRFETTRTATSLQELAEELADELELARTAGTSLRQLEAIAGDWTIPTAVTGLVDAGRLSDAIPVLEDALAVVSATRRGDEALPEADLEGLYRARFEEAADGATMATLREEAEAQAEYAEVIGAAQASRRQLVPEWQTPDVIQRPIDEGDLAVAAQVAAAAQRWIENAHEADVALPEIKALEQVRPRFEAATTLTELEDGAALAEAWNTAAGSVRAAIDRSEAPLDLLGTLGMWGSDARPLLDKAKDSAIEGDVEEALSASAGVQQMFNNASSVGGLRLAGVIFFVVAIVGVAGLWFLLRREAGPPWARQRKPHWLKDERKSKAGPRLGGGRKKMQPPPRAISPGRDKQ